MKHRVEWTFANGTKLVRLYPEHISLTEDVCMSDSFYAGTFRDAGLVDRHPRSSYEIYDRIHRPVSVSITQSTRF